MVLGPEYNAYINSLAWEIKREHYFAVKGKWCKACNSTSNIIVHHASYDHFRREPIADLVSLCQKCHREVHRLHRLGGRRVDLRTVTMLYIRNTKLIKARRK